MFKYCKDDQLQLSPLQGNNLAVLQRELIAFSYLLCDPTYPFDATLFLIKKNLCDFQDMLIGLAPIVLGVPWGWSVWLLDDWIGTGVEINETSKENAVSM